MSFSVDVNILLYASDTRSECHQKAATFLQSIAQGTEVCYLAWPTIMSYLHMATHSRMFASPLSPSEAGGNINQLLSRPHIRSLSEGEGFWSVYTQVASELPVRGNLVPDATSRRS